LYLPCKGVITIDGELLTEAHLHAWRAQVGYVPQRTMLLDASVAENIALGIARDSIDMERVRDVCKTAHIADFIESELTSGYDTRLGEGTVRLSGGQAQRLAIARALYRNPSILILDEATASLDQATEKAIAATLLQLGSHITIVSIAHRLSTIQGADTIYMLERGKLSASGTYAELIQTSPAFCKLIGRLDAA
jgi:ABC-type multidrug transport system fused ATPase/permease subunit